MSWSRRWGAVDAAVAAALALLIAYAIIDPPGPHTDWPAWSAWPVAAVVALPIAVRRRWPRTVLAVTATAAVLATALGAVAAGAIWLTFVPAVLALYTVATTASRARSLLSLVACLLASAAAILFFYADVLPTLPPAPYRSELPPYWPVEIGATWVAFGVAGATGLVVRWRRDTNARMARQLAHAAVVEERLRISRELHDVIGHSMSLIAVKATVANHVAATRPEETRAALAVIESTSRATLTEIRRVLGVLRSDESVPPGLPALTELADRARAAGVDVELTAPETALPESVALAVYRIVQEALTNVITHAAPARCRVRVESAHDAVTVEVTDDGRQGRRARPVAEGGYGLVGMRERAMMHGGDFTAGPLPGGGFRVSVRLPLGSS